MKITMKTLSLPPYISTSWDHIASLHVDPTQTLVVTLQNGVKIEIPFLESQIINTIFTMHTSYLEQEKSSTSFSPPFFKNNFKPSNLPTGNLEDQTFPMRIGIEGLEGLGSALQHNPEQANSPDLPAEILSKIAAISKVVGVEDPAVLPKPEPHCNCMHCQIARAVQNGVKEISSAPVTLEVEEVSEEDLRFRTWDIKQTSNQLYSVTNPLDSDEQYFVFLGDPIGCNCGQKNCDHIRAVLKS